MVGIYFYLTPVLPTNHLLFTYFTLCLFFPSCVGYLVLSYSYLTHPSSVFLFYPSCSSYIVLFCSYLTTPHLLFTCLTPHCVIYNFTPHVMGTCIISYIWLPILMLCWVDTVSFFYLTLLVGTSPSSGGYSYLSLSCSG